MGWGVPKFIKPPKRLRKIAKSAIKSTVKSAVSSVAGPLAGREASNVLGGAFDKAMGDKKKRRHKKRKAAHASVSSLGSTTNALSDVPGSGERAASKPQGIIGAILAILGL